VQRNAALNSMLKITIEDYLRGKDSWMFIQAKQVAERGGQDMD
jgi:hypothetical protein